MTQTALKPRSITYMDRFSVDCIVPFYNEGSRVVSVVSELLKSVHIRRIICVDDGSDRQIRLPTHSKIIAIRNSANRGKAATVIAGLQHVSAPYVVLLDADIHGLSASMLDDCIRRVITGNLDLLILRRNDAMITAQWLRFDVLFAGERLVRTDLIKSALRRDVTGYQLEAAINRYAVEHHMRAAYIDLPFGQTRKIDKVGILEGLRLEVQAIRQVTTYMRIPEIARHIGVFCHESLETAAGAS